MELDEGRVAELRRGEMAALQAKLEKARRPAPPPPPLPPPSLLDR